MTEDDSTLVTIIGAAYFQPITDLLGRLCALPEPVDYNEIQTGRHENGYSAALCILSVVCLESYFMRMRYLAPNNTSRNQNALSVFQTLHPKFPGNEELTEVYVIRDLLVHNHLWEIRYRTEEVSYVDLVEAVRAFVKKDAKYENAVDLDSYQTKS